MLPLPALSAEGRKTLLRRYAIIIIVTRHMLRRVVLLIEICQRE